MEQLFEAVRDGAVVLTASKHLARSLSGDFNRWQQASGRSVWTSPAILPVNAYLHRAWAESLLNAAGGVWMLLNDAQETAVWEQILSESPESRTLLRIPETADQARRAWALICAYRLPFHPAEFFQTDDAEAFSGWASAFKERLKENRWLEPARLSDEVAELIRRNAIARPIPVLLAGFDDITPQQQELFDALCGQHIKLIGDGNATSIALGDTHAEIRAAAAFARESLERDPEAQVGIVVPNLTALRRQVERIFAEVLPHPSFHLSVGPPLAEQPLAGIALLILELASGPLPLERMSMLIRSPFLKRSREEQASRAMLDAAMRRKCGLIVSIPEIQSLGSNMFGSLEKECRKLPAEQYPSQWSHTFSRILKAAGWPGGGTLSSDEFQIVKAWNGALSTLASLDTVSPRLSFDSALGQLRKIATGARFQFENEGAPIQILGLLEASGLRFDRLWVMGLHDEAVPPPANPNPFLPLALQRKHRLPHSSAERELEFHAKLVERLTGSAGEVVFSYPQWEGDQPLGPSPLITATIRSDRSERAAPTWRTLIRAAAAFETIADSVAPVLPPGFAIRGGTSLLKDMAACPFRAYARHRLQARALEDACLGPDPREQGTGVHKALELLWKELKTHEVLSNLLPDELRAAIWRAIDGALDRATGAGRWIERRRMERLLWDWLAIERARPPFHVLESEFEFPLEIGGLRITTRMDRVDVLPDGRRIIIDYKTSAAKSGVWAGERPDEPQVPLYCIATTATIAAAAFGHVRTGDLHFRGVSENQELGDIKEVEKGARLANLSRDWPRVLNKLAGDFRSGLAAVDPKHKGTCDYCELPALCRIYDDQ